MFASNSFEENHDEISDIRHGKFNDPFHLHYYELEGPELQYGAFGNIGIVTVPGNVAKLKIKHNNDNDVYYQLYQQLGVTKKIEFEGSLWESF